MAIQSELQHDGRLILQWSDDNRYLVKQDGSGLIVTQALDPVGMPHEYIEGDKIEPPSPPEPEPEPEPEPDPTPPMPTLDERMADAEAAICELYEMMIGETEEELDESEEETAELKESGE